MNHLRLLFLVLVAGAVLYDLGYEDQTMNETADEMFARIMADCKYMHSVGTVGGGETLEEFEQ